jgi:hypothetical protein
LLQPTSTAPLMSDKTLFYFTYSRKQQAKNVLWNMLLLPFCFGLLLWLFQGHPKEQQLTQLLLLLLLLAEGLMLWRMLWLLKHPASFTLRLTDTELSSHHPTFARWCFVAKVADMIQIEQSTDRDTMLRLIAVQMQDGSQHLLCPNYHFNRKLLYQNLKNLNPQIIVPEKPGWFMTKK